MSRTWTITARIFVSPSGVRGCSSMVEPLPSKQITRVRFPSSAPAMGKPRATRPGAFALHPHAHAVSGNMGVIGHYVLLCGAGCCLWTRGFSGRRAWPWGQAAPWAARELRSALRLVVRPGPAAHGHCGPRAPQPGLPISPVPRGPGPAVPPMPSMLVAVGVLQH